jgi:hypothetical protein
LAAFTNPRYTGRQVWNRQRKDEVLIDVHDVALGHTTKMRWNDDSKWIYSEQVAHPQIIDDQTFQRAQDVLAGRGRGPCQHRPHKRPRGYAFAGSVFCAVCQRRMQGQWINQASYYRCRFPAEYALANKVDHPRNVYIREDAFDTQVNDWIAGLFDPRNISDTIDLVMAAQDSGTDDIAAGAAWAKITDATSGWPATRPPSTPEATRPRSARGSPRPGPSASRPKPTCAKPPARPTSHASR